MNFIGKNTETLEWITGCLITFGEGNTSIWQRNERQHPRDFIGTMCDVFPDSVGLGTGEPDADGNEVFAGDVLRWESEILLLDYSKEARAFVLIFSDGTEDNAAGYKLSEMKRISRIYDAPKPDTTPEAEPIDFEAKEFQGTYSDDELDD